MSYRCTALTNAGIRCTRRTNSPSGLCYQHERKAKTKSPSGKKTRIRKAPCQAQPDKYTWVVGKGCFTKSPDEDFFKATPLSTPSSVGGAFFDKATPPPTPTPPVLGRKANMLKLKCMSTPGYTWVVGKGCFKLEKKVGKDCVDLKCDSQTRIDPDGSIIYRFPLDHYLFRSSGLHLKEQKEVRLARTPRPV